MRSITVFSSSSIQHVQPQLQYSALLQAATKSITSNDITTIIDFLRTIILVLLRKFTNFFSNFLRYIQINFNKPTLLIVYLSKHVAKTILSSKSIHIPPCLTEFSFYTNIAEHDQQDAMDNWLQHVITSAACRRRRHSPPYCPVPCSHDGWGRRR